MDKGITVRELAKDLLDAIKQGYGDRYILISGDDEGNSYHTLFFSVSWDEDMIEQALELEHDDHTPDEVVILG